MTELARAWMTVILVSLILLGISAWMFADDRSGIAALFYAPGLLGFLAFIGVTIYDSIDFSGDEETDATELTVEDGNIT